MAAPKSPVQMDGPGYYWAQMYFAETEELTDPCIVNIYRDKNDGNKIKACWVDSGAPLRIPDQWVWLQKLTPPEALVAVLG